MKSIKLLLVDDESTYLDLSSEFLRKEEKFDIDTATSAEEALDLIEEKEYDCIVSDYQMPSMDGLEFLRELKRAGLKNFPFIMFTGKGREEVAIEAMNLGADRYIQKGGDVRSQFKELAHVIKQEVEHDLIEERLKLTNYSLENADIGALWISPNGVIKYANKKICKNLGYNRGEMIGLRVSDIDPNYSNDRPQVWNEIKEEGSKTFESEHMTREGRTFPVRITSHYLKKNGEEYEFAFVRDISEQKEKTRELEMHKVIFEELTDPVMIKDVEGKYELVNDAVTEYLGFSEDEILGKTDKELFGEEAGKELWEREKQVLDKEELTTYEEKLPTQQGDCFFKTTRIPYYDEDGKLSGIIGICRDITEQKESEEKYRIMAEGSKNGIYVFQDGKFKFVNDALLEISGYRREELKKIDFQDLVHPDHAEKVKEWTEKAYRGNLSNLPERPELKIIKKDGTPIWVEVTPSLTKFDGKPAIIGNVAEIGERKKSEKELQRLSSIIKKSSEAIICTDTDFQITYMNPAAEEMYGYTLEEVEGETTRVFNAEPEDEKIQEEIYDSVSAGKTYKNVLLNKRKNGSKFYCEVKISSISGEDIEGYVSSQRDVTERKEAEKRLGQKRATLEGMLDGIEDVIGFQEPDHTIIRYNKAGYKLLGMSPAEVEGKKCYELIGREEECERCATRKALESKKIETIEKYQPELGIYLKVKSNPILDEEGEVSFVIEQLTDITDRKEAEEELKRSEKEKSLILESSPILIGFLNTDHEIIWANKKAGESVNKDPSDLVGKKCYRIWQDRNSPCKNCPVKKAMETREIEREEMETSDGRVWLLSGAPVEDEEGNLTGVIETGINITDEKMAEQRLLKYKRALENSGDIIAIADTDYRQVFVNEAFKKYYQIGDEEIVGKTIEETMGKDLFKKIKPNLDRCLEGERLHFENTREIPGLGKRTLDIRYHPVKDEDGEVQGVATIIRDITERKEAEKKIKSLNEEYETLFENIQSSLFLLDVTEENEIKFERLNPVEEEWVGFKNEEVKGKTPAELLGDELGKEVESNYRRCLEKGKPITYEEEWEGENGTKSIALTKLTPVKVEGKVEKIVGNSVDITNRVKKENELKDTIARFETLMENQESGILFENTDREIIYANEKFCEMFGIPSKDAVIGIDCRDAAQQAKTHFEDPEGFVEGIEDAIDSGEPIKGEELKLKDGRIFMRDYAPVEPIDSKVDWDLFGVEEREEKIDEEEIEVKKEVEGERGHLWQYRDMIDRKKAEEREEFLHSLLRHDVRNKAQIVKGYLELAKDSKDLEEVDEYISKAEKGAQTSIDLIEKVKTIRKLTEEEEKKEINLGKVIREVIKEKESQAAEKGIEVKYKDTGIDCKVEGGPLIKELLSNLIENSIIHSGCSEVIVSVRELDEACTVTIEDDGCGIPDEEKEKIFERGYKKGDAAGSGLGLYLVNEIAENFGGDIEVKDSDLGGARFDIILKKA